MSMTEWMRTYQFHKAHAIVGVLVLIFAIVAGNNFLQRRLCTEIEMAGNEYSDSSIAFLLLSQRIGDPIFDIDKKQLRHELLAADPWIDDVDIFRSITGKLSVEVFETKPVVRLVDKNGLAEDYVDRVGKVLPSRYPASFDLPLIHALTQIQEIARAEDEETIIEASAIEPQSETAEVDTRIEVASPVLSRFIHALSDSDDSTNALVSEIELDNSGVVLSTTPTFGSRSIRVLMGRSGFDTKLESMRAFWDSEPHNLNDIEYVDLRFEGQVIARFATPPIVSDEAAPDVAQLNIEIPNARRITGAQAEHFYKPQTTNP